MTDKQIIIDGVDVSGCTYIIPPRKQCPNKPMPYAKETSCFACKEHNTKLNFCKNNPNCYYKQLKAKEQECEELNNDNHTLLITRQKLLNDLWIAEESLKDFKEICDKQCEQLEAYKMEAEEGKEINAELKAENEELKNRVAELSLFQLYKIQRDEAEKTLAEIKEIAERDRTFCIKCNGDKDIDCIDCIEGGRALLAKDILQKISEVEE